MRHNQVCIRESADEAQINDCREKISEHKELLNKLSQVLALAGNEVRMKILFLLREEKELCPCDLSDILGMSTPAVSQHLRKLKDGNIVKRRRDGQTIYYSLIEEQQEILLPIFNYIDNQKMTV